VQASSVPQRTGNANALRQYAALSGRNQPQRPTQPNGLGHVVRRYGISAVKIGNGPGNLLNTMKHPA
jgi:hypothetical protein